MLTLFEHLIRNGKDLNIITDIMIEDAIKEAIKCDEIRLKKNFDFKN